MEKQMTQGETTHAAAMLFPMMSDADLRALADDIRENGLRQPIVLAADGLLVDGRNRRAACELAGVEPEYAMAATDADPFALAVSLNVKRRNLTAGQRAVAAAEAWEVPTVGTGEKRHKVLAEMFSVNHAYVQQARALVERAPDLAASVKAGGATMADATTELRQREGRVKVETAKRASLRERDPDLADEVDAEVRKLEDALAEAERRATVAEKDRRAEVAAVEERARRDQARRESATGKLLDTLDLFAHPASAASDVVPYLDDGIAAERSSVLSSSRIDEARAYLGVLAEGLRGQGR